MHSDAAQLAELVARVDSGDLKIWVAERLPLAELPAVHARAAAQFAKMLSLIAAGTELGVNLTQVDPVGINEQPAATPLAGKTVLIP